MRTTTWMKGAVGALAAAGTMALIAAPANAAIVCNGAGDCWHVHHHWDYPGGGYAWHPDDWYFHRTWGGGPYHWHDWHDGRGYWRNGAWVNW